MQTTELTCAQCGRRYYSGKPLCPICTDAAHRAYVAALEAVAAAAREAWECPEYPERWRDTLHERLAALDALEEGSDG